ncbi:MAG: shikimate dehydrogenase, partial [Nocardioides sp.]|nr:shikimate dehydrogenase [Nocardioides sp.]
MKCAVLGDPVAHSLSPVLHRAGYAALGLDWEYDARRVPSGGLPGFLETLDESWRGLSLTMPLKREAMPLADNVSERAALVGAANTLVLDDGAVHADNTDLPGAVAALRERYAGAVTGGTVLGGGATAAS